MASLTRDPLTQAYQREGLHPFGGHFVAENARNGAPLSLLVFDIDHFKGLNDTFGHDYGDLALREVAARVQASLRGEDLLFRWGGDEFVVLLPGTDLADATRIAERVLERAGRDPLAPPPGQDDGVAVSLSIGVASCPRDALDIDALFRCADRRLLGAKRLGRGRVVAHDVADGELDFERAASRSLERDGPLETGRRFLEALRRSGRALLSVDGARGAGRSHYLHELARAARLHGVVRLELRGDAALARRELGTLRSGRLDGAPLPLADTDLGWSGAVDALTGWLQREERTRLLVTADGIDAFDGATLETCRALLAQPGIAVGLAYCGEHGGAALPFGSPDVRATLEPLSPAAAAAWLRSVLGGALPEGLDDHLAERTSGLPGGMRRLLERLHASGELARRGGRWRFRADPTEPLERPPAPPRLRAPAPPSLLIGRTAELAALALASERHRLVTLTGPGGIGKTHLALQHLHERGEAHRDGAVYVVLDADGGAPVGAPAETADDEGADALAAAVARGCGLALPRGGALRPALLDALRDRELLLVLDLGESRLGGPAALAELAELPGLKIVALAREPLGLPGEALVPLRGLPLPPAGSTGTGPAAASVRLFLERCAGAGLDLTRPMRSDPTVRDAVVRVCRGSGGSPLVLELAAHWAPALGLAELADRIADGGTVPHGGVPREIAPEIAPRVRSALASFWDLLGPRERQTLAALARFRGAFGPEAARRVAGASRFFLLALQERGFVRGEEGRYRMQASLREFAAPELHDAGGVAARYLAFHAERAADLATRSADAVTVDAYREVDAAWGDYRRAFEAAIAALGRGDAEAAAAFRPLATLLRGYLDVRGRIGDGSQLFGAAVEAFDRSAGSDAADPADAAWAHESLALFSFHRGDDDRAAAHAETARELLETCVATAYAAPPDDLADAGALPSPAAGSERALRGYALTLNTLGMIACQAGDLAAGRRRFAHALALRRALGDPIGTAQMLGNLAIATGMAGDAARSIELRRAANEVQRELGNSSSLAMGRSYLGLALLGAGRLDEAAGELTAARRLAERIGYPLVAGNAALGEARAALARGDTAAARHAAERSVAAYATMAVVDTPAARALWACCLAFDGALEQAADVSERVRIDALLTRDPRDADDALRALAARRLTVGDRTGALERFRAIRDPRRPRFAEVDARLRELLGEVGGVDDGSDDSAADPWTLLREAEPEPAGT